MFKFSISAAIIESVKNGYNRKNLIGDINAAIVVSLIALPLCMALAIAVGLPPQHGIYTGIIAGILTPILGGSKTQVSGPTAAFVVILAPIVAIHGLAGLMLAQIIAGIIIVIIAFLRIGSFINLTPYPVTTGFTAGIGVVIGTMSLNDFLGLGLKLTGHFHEKLLTIISNIPNINFAEALVGFTTLAILIIGPKITKKIPATIVAVMVASIIANILNNNGLHIETIFSKFSFTDSNGILKNGIPSELPNFIWLDFNNMNLSDIMMPAITIAILAALESLLSATVADSLAKTKHDPHSELLAIGTSNILISFFGGIAATGGIARTAANIKAGAQSPLASALHAFLILLYVLFFAKYINYIPMASLAAILLMTSYHMSHYKQCIALMKSTASNDKIVLILCFAFTVLVDMVFGVTIGIIAAILLLVKDMAKKGHLETEIQDNKAIIKFRGPLFFANASDIVDKTDIKQLQQANELVIDLTKVTNYDMSSVVIISDMINIIGIDNVTIKSEENLKELIFSSSNSH